VCVKPDGEVRPPQFRLAVDAGKQAGAEQLLLLGMIFDGRGGGIRRLAPETRHITALMRLAL
jgi:hypothetical protein